jgi:hypothetical protein
MPGEAEKQEIAQRVTAVIEQDYFKDFLEIYGLAISVVEIHEEAELGSPPPQLPIHRFSRGGSALKTPERHPPKGPPAGRGPCA